MNRAIRKIETDSGQVSTLAGHKIDMTMEYVGGLCLDSKENLYFSESRARRIHKVTPEGKKSVIFKLTGNDLFNFTPGSLCIDNTDTNMYVIDLEEKTGITTLYRINISSSPSSTRPNLNIMFKRSLKGHAFGMTIDRHNDLYFITSEDVLYKYYTKTRQFIRLKIVIDLDDLKDSLSDEVDDKWNPHRPFRSFDRRFIYCLNNDVFVIANLKRQLVLRLDSLEGRDCKEKYGVYSKALFAHVFDSKPHIESWDHLDSLRNKSRPWETNSKV
mmetsp:Transcript_7730/g.8510  ORF Transcript_7730/g.8510 Transcript_7730/m.8510 type:complete len:272 (+) Transcript_7730:622-1437(+)